jgi:hypothetical protein
LQAEIGEVQRAHWRNDLTINLNTIIKNKHLMPCKSLFSSQSSWQSLQSAIKSLFGGHARADIVVD